MSAMSPVGTPAVIAGSVFAATEIMAATPYAGDLAVGSGVLTAAVGVLACGAVASTDKRYAAPAITFGTTWTLAGSWATWTLATGPGVVNTIGGAAATGLVTLACWGTRWVRSGDPLTAAKVATEQSRTALNLAKLNEVTARVEHVAGEDEKPWEELPATVWEPRATVPATADPIDVGGGVTIPLEGGHILLAGVTGAGKSVIMACTIADLLIRAHVRMLVIDPKGDRLLGCLVGTGVTVVREIDDVVTALEGVVETMRRRGAMVTEWAQAYRRGEIDEPHKVWQATEEEPWDVVVVDEFTDIAGTPAMDLIDQVARKSRSLGQTVVMGTQSVGADLFATARSRTGGGLRSQFSTLICGRVNNVTESDKLFGSGQAGKGWNAARLPGDGHVLVQSPKHREPVMMRVPEMSMPLFADVARRYAGAPESAHASLADVVIPAPREPVDTVSEVRTTVRERIIDHLIKHGESRAKDVSDATGDKVDVVRATFKTLRDRGVIEGDGAGKFWAKPTKSNVLDFRRP